MVLNSEGECLGSGNKLDMKKIIIAKWLWRFPLENDSLLLDLIKSKYGLHVNGWDSNISKEALAAVHSKTFHGMLHFLAVVNLLWEMGIE